MVDHDARDTNDTQKPAAGFQDLSMNELPSSVGAEAMEVPERTSRLWLFVLLVLVAAGLIVFGARLLRNATPGQEAETRLRNKLSAIESWEQGALLQAKYVAGNKVRLEIASRLSTNNTEDRDIIRNAVGDVLKVLMTERPGRDLYVEGYQGDEQIARARYQAKTTLVGPGGEQVPDIVIRIEGDPEGGMGQAYGETRSGFGR